MKIGKPPYNREEMINACNILISDRMRYAMGIANQKGMCSERTLSKLEIDWFTRARKTLEGISDDDWQEFGWFKDATMTLKVIGQRDGRFGWSKFIREHRKKIAHELGQTI